MKLVMTMRFFLPLICLMLVLQVPLEIKAQSQSASIGVLEGYGAASEFSEATLVSTVPGTGSPAVSTVGTSSTAGAVGGSMGQRHTFYAAGRHWIFWTDGRDAFYASSTDAVTWTAPTLLGTTPDGTEAAISVYYDGRYVHYVRVESGTVTITKNGYYRRGTPNPDGSITWSAPEQGVYGTSGIVYGPASVAVDSEGYPWVAFFAEIAGVRTGRCWKSSVNDGTWVTQSGFPIASEHSQAIVPLTGRKMALVTCAPGVPEKIYCRIWNGTGWEATEDPGIVTANRWGWSVTTYGDDIHIICMTGATPSDLVYAVRKWGVGWRTGEVVLARIQKDAVLSVDKSGNIYAFIVGYPGSSDVSFIVKDVATGKWSPIYTMLSGEDALQSYSASLKAHEMGISITWAKGSAAPFSVRYGYLNYSLAIKIENLSPGQKVEMYNATSGALIARATAPSGQTNVIIDGPDLLRPTEGYFKVYATDGATLIFTTGNATLMGNGETWKFMEPTKAVTPCFIVRDRENATWTWTLTLSRTMPTLLHVPVGHSLINVILPDGGAFTINATTFFIMAHNSTHDRFMFRFEYAPTGAGTYKVYTSSVNIVEQVKVHDVLGEGQRYDVAVRIVGPTGAMSNAEVPLRIFKEDGTELSSYTGRTDADGWANIAITAPSIIGRVVVQAEASTGHHAGLRTRGIIVTRVEITLSGPSRVPRGTTPTITWTAKYAHDGTPFTGEVKISGEVPPADGRVTYSVASISGGTHPHVTAFRANTVDVIFTGVKVTLSAAKTHIGVGEKAPITVSAVYTYDNAPASATLNLDLVQTKVGKYTYKAIDAGGYPFETNTLDIIFDRVVLSLVKVENLKDKVILILKATWEYDGRPVAGARIEAFDREFITDDQGLATVEIPYEELEEEFDEGIELDAPVEGISAFKELKVTVKQAQVHLSLSGTQFEPVITIKITDEGGDPIPNMRLTITIAGVEYKVVTDSEGVATIMLDKPLTGEFRVIIPDAQYELHDAIVDPDYMLATEIGENIAVSISGPKLADDVLYLLPGSYATFKVNIKSLTHHLALADLKLDVLEATSRKVLAIYALGTLLPGSEFTEDFKVPLNLPPGDHAIQFAVYFEASRHVLGEAVTKIHVARIDYRFTDLVLPFLAYGGQTKVSLLADGLYPISNFEIPELGVTDENGELIVSTNLIKRTIVIVDVTGERVIHTVPISMANWIAFAVTSAIPLTIAIIRRVGIVLSLPRVNVKASVRLLISKKDVLKSNFVRIPALMVIASYAIYYAVTAFRVEVVSYGPFILLAGAMVYPLAIFVLFTSYVSTYQKISREVERLKPQHLRKRRRSRRKLS